MDIADNGYSPGYFHGFIPAYSKTDNFKVPARKSACLTIIKFLDNGDGKYTLGELLLNWPVTVFDSAGGQVQGQLYTGTDDIKHPTCRFAPCRTVAVNIVSSNRTLIFGNTLIKK